LFVISINNSAVGQDYIINGTFNSTYIGDDVPPTDWFRCDSFADVTIVSNPIAGAVQDCYLQMRTRSTTYYEANVNDHIRNTREYISQILAKPLESNSRYRFSARARHNPNATFKDAIAEKCNTSYPVKLEVLGGNDSCNINDVLVTTDVIKELDWKTYKYYFNIEDTFYSYIKIQVQWDIPNIQDSAYNGELLLDSVGIELVCNITDTIKHEVMFEGDNKTVLKTQTIGSSYSWTPKENLIPKYSQVATMQYCILDENRNPVDQYVTVIANSCPIVEKFKINLDCNILHPKKNDTLFYMYFEPVILKADSTGNNYEWTPKKHLSSYSIWNPKITGYESFYSVYIKDKYFCEFYNYFNIKAECYKLVPGGTAIVMDTILKEKTDFTLSPKVGKVLNCSWTPVENLATSEIDNCQTAVVDPINLKTYYVTVEDSFDCTHTEGFRIDYELKVPNVITPNGDGYNDLFIIPGLPDNTALKIFDRNGLIIFSANPYTQSNFWDGTEKNNKPVAAGTYWYVLDNPKLGVIKKGFILVIR
jgi:gliding motility-associated-like protein